ncbi:Gx transporter family protein [Parablautia muri]|uniref:Gx transporter family protein n=1 Tax=Parablautia muri TaxID=2320879 RepID=A0A9X5BD16_9FIRM|nr:Gx transporter family protein [Parablautia muri]NBJ91503.1 Gx transporter family protein [Parablautia muri]
MKMKTAYLGLLLAFALILSYIETLISLQIGIPGIKLGLANLAVVLCLYLFGWKEALFLTMGKALLSGLMFGNLFMILYSLSGAVLSAIVMTGLKESRSFHVPVVSAVGGVAHNMGQLLIAAFVVKTYGVFYYLPALMIAGLITGIVIGMVSSLVLPYIQTIVSKGIT